MIQRRPLCVGRGVQRASGLTFALVALVAGTGCIDDLPPGWKIADARVLGVRVEVVGDESVAAPSPGDTARISVLFAEPPGTESEPIGWAFLAGPGLVEGDERPIALEVPIPDAATLGTTRSVTTAGIVCSNGTPVFGAGEMLPSCSAGATRSTTLTYTLSLARDGVPANRNPALGDELVQLDDVLWEAPSDPLPATGCAAMAGTGALPLAPVSTTAKMLRVFVADGERESFTRSDGTPGREVITLSHFTSGGELERQFSVWEGDAVALPEGSEIEWTPTAITPSADGTLVRFWFVARDGRGGLSFTTRAACVVP